ncbi:MAG: hypothetical protein ACLVF2_13135 [Faecalibacterium sp.]
MTNWFDGELDESRWSVKDMVAAMADPKAGPILKQISDTPPLPAETWLPP